MDDAKEANVKYITEQKEVSLKRDGAKEGDAGDKERSLKSSSGGPGTGGVEQLKKVQPLPKVKRN